MTEIKVSRRSSDGRTTTYCVAVMQKTDRTLHNVTVGHNELYGFATHQELLGFVFEQLLATTSKERIVSAFRLKDLLEHDHAIRHAVEERAFDPEREKEEAVREWLTA